MENLTLIKPEKVQNIINKFCVTIGMIPTSYKMSLTYEEQILAIGHYLETTVYPAINNNAEALAELQNLYVDLKNYVDNYFDNLDVQKEINNKLDEMAQSGELQQIIESYLNISSIIAFNSVAEMKEATNLINGSFVRTYGFYSKNDNGGSFYKIREIENTDVVNEMTVIALNNTNLVAEFIPTKSFINVKQLGFNENETETNIVNKLNDILLLPFNFELKNLMFNINNSIVINSNSEINFYNTHIINTSISNRIFILDINGKENIKINGLNSILEFTKPETAQQACIRINNSKNINIEGFTLIKAGGDGLYLNGTTNKQTENVIIRNCIIDNNRRNGISVTGGVYRCLIDNCKITNTIGTLPEYAIDLEPWQDEVFNDTITIQNCYFSDNNGDAIDILKLNKNIIIQNNIFDSNGLHSIMTLSQGAENYPKNCIIKNNQFLNTSIYLRGLQYAEFSILENIFENSNISTDTESDFVTFINEISKNGFLNIKNNIINNANATAIILSGASNAYVIDNLINNCGKRAFTITQSNNVTIKNNTVRNYQMANDSTEADHLFLVQTSSNVDVIENTFEKNESYQLNLTNLINIASSTKKTKFIGNKAKIGNYTNMFYNGSSDTLFVNNESKTIFNDTTKYLPEANEKYVGFIYNYFRTDHYEPYICVYVDSSYKWKKIALT